MADLKVRIEVGQETSGDGVELQEKETRSEKSKTAIVSLVAHQALANGKQILNYGISNIGNFTGNYIKQEQIQTAMSAINDIATIGVGIATGPVGAVVSVVGVALNKSLEAVSYFQDLEHKRIETDYLRERSGNSLLNGSRGTEN